MNSSDFYLYKQKNELYLGYDISKNEVPSCYQVVEYLRDLVWYHLYLGSSLTSEIQYVNYKELQPLFSTLGKNFLEKVVSLEKEYKLEPIASNILQDDGFETCEENVPCLEILFGQNDKKKSLYESFFEDEYPTKNYYGGFIICNPDELDSEIIEGQIKKKHNKLVDIISKEVLNNPSNYRDLPMSKPFVVEYSFELLRELCNSYFDYILPENQKIILNEFL